MGTHFAPLGTLSYGGLSGTVTFPGDVNTRISTKHVMSGDGRTIKYVEHVLHVEGWVYSSDLTSSSGTCDNAFERFKEILSTPAGRLTIVGKGWGDLYLNRDTAGNRDIIFGPFPEVIDWEPFGNVNCRFTWSVKFTLPYKLDVSGRGNIIDYWWTTLYNYDSEGFASRTIQGELEMTGSRRSPGDVKIDSHYHIEQYYRKTIKVDCPLGMRRERSDFQFNAAKTKCNFTIVDVPMKGFIYPPGIVDMDINHEMMSVNGDMTLSNWMWIFRATAVADADAHPIWAYRACIEAHQQRFGFMIRRAANSEGVVIPTPVSFHVSENVRQRRTNIVAVWTLFSKGRDGKNGTHTPIDILSRGGMWQPFDWKASDHKVYADRPGGPNNSGGFSQLVSDSRQNIIMDMSAYVPYTPDPGKTEGVFDMGRTPNEKLLVQAPFGQYIEFKAWILTRQEGGVWHNYPLAPNGNNVNFKRGVNAQLINSPYNEYIFRGKILRIGTPPAGVPQLKEILGLKCYTPAGQKALIETKPVFNAMGLVIWCTEWYIPLRTAQPDNSNPVKRTDDGNGDIIKPTKPPGAENMPPAAADPDAVGAEPKWEIGAVDPGPGSSVGVNEIEDFPPR